MTALSKHGFMDSYLALLFAHSHPCLSVRSYRIAWVLNNIMLHSYMFGIACLYSSLYLVTPTIFWFSTLIQCHFFLVSYEKDHATQNTVSKGILNPWNFLRAVSFIAGGHNIQCLTCKITPNSTGHLTAKRYGCLVFDIFNGWLIKKNSNSNSEFVCWMSILIFRMFCPCIATSRVVYSTFIL